MCILCILLSTSKQGLQNNLNCLHAYCNEWDMVMNTTKTKTMSFSMSQASNDEFYFGSKKLEHVSTYKYLGTIFQSNGKISECTKDLYHRSLKAMFKLTKSFKSEPPNFNTAMHLFDHLVRPILTYCSEIWGPFLLKGKPLQIGKHIDFDIEKCNIKFLRYAIGINKRTPNFSIYGETGRFPLSIEVLCNSLKYYNRLLDMEEGSILHGCLVENMKFKQKDSWISNMKLLCENTLNFNLLSINLGKKYLDINNLKQHLQKLFKAWWKDKLFDDRGNENGNKLRSYRTYKTIFVKEEYLNILDNRQQRSKFAKLRLSCHKLHIETGRYAKKEVRLNPDERICKQCNTNKCEDEYHFTMVCSLYEKERSEMIENVAKIYPRVKNYDKNQLFTWIMANLDPSVIKIVTKYIHKCFIKRLETSNKSQGV